MSERCIITGCNEPGMYEIKVRLPEWFDENTWVAESARNHDAWLCEAHQRQVSDDFSVGLSVDPQARP